MKINSKLWKEIVSRLDVRGSMSRAMLEECVFKSCEDFKISLLLPLDCQPYFDENILADINDAVKTFLGERAEVNIQQCNEEIMNELQKNEQEYCGGSFFKLESLIMINARGEEYLLGTQLKRVN